MSAATWPLATRAQRQLLQGLHDADERRRSGLLLLEGSQLLGEALEAGLVPRLVAVEPTEAEDAAVARAAARGALVVRLAAREAAALSARVNAPGLLAALAQPPAWDGEVPASGPVLVVALCGLQDPGNVGTLLRSSLAFGAAGVLLLEGTADASAPKVVRAAAGASLRLRLRREAFASLAGFAGARALQAAAAEAGEGPGEPLPERCLLLLGHETRGVPELPGAVRLSIAHEPAVDSLNVGVAGSILLARWYAEHR